MLKIMFMDNWVPRGRSEVNMPVLIEIQAVKEKHFPSGTSRSGLWVVELADGSFVQRFDSYMETSPYGWNPLDEKGQALINAYNNGFEAFKKGGRVVIWKSVAEQFAFSEGWIDAEKVHQAEEA